MATIPGVSNNELVRTTWGNSVATELNSNTVKKTAAQTMAGPLTVTGLITANAQIVISDTAPTLASHAVRKDYVDNKYVLLAGDVMTGFLTINPAGATNTCLRVCGSGPIVEWRNEANSSRFGYIDATSTLMRVTADTADLELSVDGVAQIHCDANNVLFGKTVSDDNNDGVSIFSGTSTGAGRIVSTGSTGTVGSNFYGRHVGTMDAEDEYFFVCQRSTLATTAGYIRQGAGSNTVFNAMAGGSHVATSDYRLKEVLGPVDDPVGRLMALQPKHVEWKPESGTSGDFDAFIAHELAEVVPNAVTGTKDATKPPDDPDDPGGIEAQGTDLSKVVPLLTAALQSALTTINNLTARIEALEGGAA